MLVRAGERAASLAAAAEAQALLRAGGRARGRSVGAGAALLDRAGEMAGERPATRRRRAGSSSESIELVRGARATRMPPRGSRRRLGERRLLHRPPRRGDGTAMERAFDVISADEPDEDLALLAARLGLGYWFRGDLERAAERAELALDIAEAHRATRSRSRVALPREERASPQSRGHARGVARARSSVRSRSRSSTISHEASDVLLHPLRPVLPARRVRRGARIPRRGARARADGSATVRTSGRARPSGRTRCACSAAGTRRRRRAPSSRRSRSTPAGSC